MTTPGVSGNPERFEQMRPPEITETDHRHIKAYVDFLKALQKGRLDSVGMHTELALLLQETTHPSNNDYTDIKAQIEEWVEKYSFDVNSTEFGDRSTDVIDATTAGVHVYSDPDGSGKRSANIKRGAIMCDVAQFLAVCPDSRLSAVARGSILTATVTQAASYRQMTQPELTRELGTEIERYAEVYMEAGDLDQLLLVIGAAHYANMLTNQAELEYITVDTTIEDR